MNNAHILVQMKRDAVITRIGRFPLSSEVPREERAFFRRLEKAYLRGEKTFKYHGQLYQVPEQFILRMWDPAEKQYKDIPMEKVVEHMTKSDDKEKEEQP